MGEAWLQQCMWALALAALVAGCGSWKKVGSGDPQLAPSETLTQLFEADKFYRHLGRLAAGDPLPFVGSIALVDAPADSSTAIISLSLENRALSFQKERDIYTARYRVDVGFQPTEGGRPVAGGQDETVRVSTLQETLRADESVLFQKVFRLLPGTYQATVSLRDLGSGNQTRAEMPVTVPAFGPGSTTAPILAYQVSGRDRIDQSLEIVINPRGTVAFGGDTLLAYIEGYSFPGPTAVPLEVRTQTDSLVYRDSLRFQGGREVESQVIRLRPDSMALGELQLVVGDSTSRRRVSALVSFSTAWVVTNFDEMLNLLRYFGEDEKLSRIKKAAPEERAELWRQFLKETDPNPATPENEALNDYFKRVALANVRFRDEGVPGWRTDRGEVFIALGEPDDIVDASAMAQGRVIRWTYLTHRLTLYFVDDAGFGRFRLNNTSRADFERTLNRIRRMAS